MTIFLSAGLVQAADVSDDLNTSIGVAVEAAENASQESNAFAVAETGNDTEVLAQTANDAVATETVTAIESVTAVEVLALIETANETEGYAAEIAPEKVEEGAGEIIATVCLNGCNYTTIQAAIEAAEDGEVVEVESGTYNENVVVDKSITLRGVDTGEGVPVVNARGNGSAVILKADGIVLEGLYITNAGSYPSAGIEVVSNDNLIAGLGVWNSEWVGIYLKGCTNTTISESISSNNGNDGILAFRAPGNFVKDNVVSNNGDDGIQLLNSDNVRVESNVVVNNTDVGIFLDTSQNIVVVGNTLSYNNKGIGLKNSGIDRVGPNRFLNNTQELEVA
ncbi:MAG TPA: NosD domain-containing protein [Methanothrix sp.]|nr:NosD domain-containing protein [Methanothrix sp.]HPJ85139.1 NosD domain-containing protein [Methanothrix sp.]HPR66552.1 NosD domain-containing protein [Methanothrix sp.]